MKLLHFSPLAFLISFLVLLSSKQVASHPNLDKFLRCVSQRSNSLDQISDVIYTPANCSSFKSVLRSYIRNERFNQSTTPKPLAIVTPLDESHVRATVVCAKYHGLPLRVRSGGHDYEGLSYVSHDPFVLLDMFNLRAIDIDIASETAWAQAGATLGELYYKISTLSKTHAFPAGVCPTLGLGGHISGGGYGNLLRKYGLSIDNVIDARVVDANGNILDRQAMGEDLFWSIRGGGAASFCVVLAWKIKLVQVPATITVFNVGRTIEEGVTQIVDQWQRVAPNMDPHLFIRAQPRVVKGSEYEGNKTVQVRFIALYLGSATNLVRLVKKSFPLLGLDHKDCIEMPWINSTLYWFGLPLSTPLEELASRTWKPRFYAKYRSDYVQQPIPEEGLDAIWKKLLEFEDLYLQFNPYGGMMSQVPENATAFPHRAGNLFKIQHLSVWSEPGEEIARRYTDASKQLYDALAPYVSKNPREHFLNYRDLDVGTNENGNSTFGAAYFKGNLPRLIATKARVDPDNFFRYEQSIPLTI